MSDQEFIIALAAIAGGIGFAIFLFYNIFSLIKSWINRKSRSSNNEIDPQFFKALGEFKKNTDRRLANLEAIVSDTDEVHNAAQIEIEEEELRESDKKGTTGNLRNMLNE